MTIRVNVTQRDIDSGMKNNMNRCAVARALHRHKETRYADVTDAFILTGVIPAIRIPLPVRKLIRRIDAGKPVQPFSFDIEFLT